MNTIKLRSSLNELEKGIIEKTMTHEELKSAILALDNELYDLGNNIAIAAEMAAMLSERAGANDRELSKDTIDTLIAGHEATKAFFNVLTDYLYEAKASFDA